MPKQFKPTDSKSLFVGREREFERIDRVLENRQAEWLIQIHGDGGIGKTRFLESLRERIGEKRGKKTWRCTELIDFYKTSNRTTFGLLEEIARQLGRDCFPQFGAQLAAFREILTQQPDASQYQEAMHRVANAFFEDWRQFLKAGARVLLLFDTCEEMHDLAPWVMNTMLPQLAKIQEELQADSPALQTQAVMVWATRDSLEFPAELEKYLQTITLAPLSMAEVKEFFRQAKLYPGRLRQWQLEELNKRCGGRPLFVALSYDWLKNGAGAIEDLLGNHTPFGEELVSWISRLKDFQSDALIIAALAWRRMEPGLLATLLNLPESEAAALLETLGQFSFAKHRPPAKGFAGSFQLHDEMRALIKRRFWPAKGDLTIKARLQEVIDWYKTRIANPDLLEGRALPQTDERRALLAEYVYYQCELDPNAGSKIGEQLFKHNIHFAELPFCELLNREISRFEQRLFPHRLDQLRFQQALTAFRKDDYAWAGLRWRELIRRLDYDRKMQATCNMMLVELECYAGNYNEALRHAEAAEDLYQNLLQQTNLDQDKRNLATKELGQLYHNRGLAYRFQGRLEEALQDYEKALMQGGTEKNTARCFNNIGYVYLLKGDAEKAATYAGKALQIRQRLKIPYELGLGNNTLGMIMENMGRIHDAADLYRKAYNYFAGSGSDRGLALAQINLGRLMRITNAFEQALEYLNAAAKVLEKKGDTSYLIIVLNEIGCTYRQQGTPAARHDAKKYLDKSLDLSRQIDNHQAAADNLDDLQILFYQWGCDLKRQGQIKQGEEYLLQSMRYGREAEALAKQYNLKTILANIERTTGEIDFELQDYEKAFKHFLNACQLIAQAANEKGRSTLQFQQRLTENANRLQRRLHTLPMQQEAQYAEKILGWMDDFPQDILSQLGILRNILTETVQLSRYPIATF